MVFIHSRGRVAKVWMVKTPRGHQKHIHDDEQEMVILYTQVSRKHLFCTRMSIFFKKKWPSGSNHELLTKVMWGRGN